MFRKKHKLLLGFALLLIITGLFLYRVKIKWLFEDVLQKPLPKAVIFQNTAADKTLLENIEINLNVNAIIAGNPQKDFPIKLSTDQNTEPQSPANTPLESVTSYNLNVPFTMQAPFSDWSEPWQNTCEEANILMVHYYYQDKTFTKKIAQEELLKLVAWQNKNFGSYVDTSIAQTAEMVEKNWGYKTQIIDNPTVNQIKKFTTDGFPVILPTAGRELKNPYFIQPGPIYHMITVKGYTADEKFITNDPGIGRGHDYLYSIDTLMNSMHDWNGSEENILQGAKKILIILP